MKPILKTYLDTAADRQADALTCNDAIRRALSLVESDLQHLLASFRYLVSKRSETEAADTFLEAIVDADGVEALLESIDTPEEFLQYLANTAFRDLLRAHLRREPKVRKLALQASLLRVQFSFSVVKSLCELGGARGLDFLRPTTLSAHYIDDMLAWLELPAEKFLGSVADSIVEDCMGFLPHNTGREWLSTFLEDLVEYYGDTAKPWMIQQIGSRKSEPSFWQVAMELLLKEDLPEELLALDLSGEQHSWLRNFRLQRIRDELYAEYRHLRHFAKSGVVVVQAPLFLHHASTSEFPGHAFRPVWSWLMSEAAEAAIYSWFREACSDLSEDYDSPEDSITGALCAYLKSHGSKYRDLINAAWEAGHPKQQLQLDVDYVDCRRGRDVGGADLVLVLSANAVDTYARSSFVAFQCKKLKAGLSLSARELVQKEQLRSFTHAAYYMLYPCETMDSRARGPVVASARTVDGLLRARQTRTLSREVLLGVGRGLEEYFVADLLPGWSGDERWETPETIREVVDAALRPVRILQATVTAVPREEG